MAAPPNSPTRDAASPFMERVHAASRDLPPAHRSGFSDAAQRCAELFARVEAWTYYGTSCSGGVSRARGPDMCRPPMLDGDTPPALHTSRNDAADAFIAGVDAAVEQEVAQARVLIARTKDLPLDARCKLEEAMATIDNRRRDNRLFLGIVGEFSSGKSTLINALTRNPLLATSVLPATTHVPTIIAAGVREDVEVILSNGAYLTFLHDGVPVSDLVWGWLSGDVCVTQDKAKIRDFVTNHSASGDTDGHVRQVNVLSTLPGLHEELAIVDTPGINAHDKPEHQERTRAALRELCDAVIVVAPANAPLSQTLLAFVRDELQPLAHRLLFVLTKIDLIRDRERDAVLRHSRGVLQRELAIANPVVLPMSALSFIDALGATDTSTRPALAQSFLQVESSILSFLRANRSLMLLETVITLLVTFHDNLSTSLRCLRQQYSDNHQKLLDAQIPDLKTAVVSWQESYLTKLRGLIAGPAKRFRSQMSEISNAASLAMRSAVSAARDKESLQTALSTAVQETVEKVATECRQASADFAAAAAGACRQLHEEFFTEFEQAYARLMPCAHAGIAAPGKVPVITAPGAELTAMGSLNVMTTLRSAIKLDGYFQTGGALAGAALGQFLIPVPIVGLLVGGFIGSKVRNVFGPSLDTLRTEGLRQVSPILEQHLDDLHRRVREHEEALLTTAEETVRAMVATYGSKYHRLACQLIEEDNQLRAEMLFRQDEIDKSLRTIAASQHNLTAWAEKARQTKGFS